MRGTARLVAMLLSLLLVACGSGAQGNLSDSEYAAKLACEDFTRTMVETPDDIDWSRLAGMVDDSVAMASAAGDDWSRLAAHMAAAAIGLEERRPDVVTKNVVAIDEICAPLMSD